MIGYYLLMNICTTNDWRKKRRHVLQADDLKAHLYGPFRTIPKCPFLIASRGPFTIQQFGFGETWASFYFFFRM
jgi:hypothetical protein